MTLNKYTMYARLAPALLCALPFLVFYYFYLSPALAQMFTFLNSIKIISGLSFPIILIFFLAQINRHLSKVIFQRFYFKDELYMPTTNFLLYSNNQFTEEYKNDIRRRIYDSVDVKIPNKKNEEKNELLSRKRIVEAMGIIRIMCEDNELLLQHNTEYGFFRNLIGGSVIALPSSLFFAFVFFYNGQTNSIAGNFLLGLASIFLILLIFSKHLIKEFGKNYAHILLRVFIAKCQKVEKYFQEE